MPEQRKFPAWLKESIGVLVVLTGYGVLGAQFLMKYPNYPKDVPSWMNPLDLVPEPFAWLITLLIFADGVGGVGILSILITSAFVRIKYYWHWMAITGVSISIIKTLILENFDLASNGLLTSVLILLFALPFYFIRVHIYENRLKAKTE